DPRERAVPRLRAGGKPVPIPDRGRGHAFRDHAHFAPFGFGHLPPAGFQLILSSVAPEHMLGFPASVPFTVTRLPIGTAGLAPVTLYLPIWTQNSGTPLVAQPVTVTTFGFAAFGAFDGA